MKLNTLRRWAFQLRCRQVLSHALIYSRSWMTDFDIYAASGDNGLTVAAYGAEPASYGNWQNWVQPYRYLGKRVFDV